MKILGRHTSYNVQKVLWLADELSLEYQHEQIGGRFGGTDSKEFLMHNPFGKVPVLVTEQGAINESNTIVRYLADQYGPNTWLPSEPMARSRVESLMDWSIDRLEPAFVAVFWGYYRTPSSQRDDGAIADAVHNLETCLDQLSEKLGQHDFLLGSSPTLADIATGIFLHRLIAIELAIAVPGNITDWYMRLGEREAYKTWVMSDFTELQGRAGY